MHWSLQHFWPSEQQMLSHSTSPLGQIHIPPWQISPLPLGQSAFVQHWAIGMHWLLQHFWPVAVQSVQALPQW
jgi:hypothetical protein